MSARHAVLGLLLDRPAYAYELRNRLQEQLGPTWAINSGQLSQLMSSLEADGLIRESGRGQGRRRVVEITEDGLVECERWWFEESPGAALSRRPLLVKLMHARPERLQACLQQIEAYELECARRLQEVTKQHDAVSGGPQLRAEQVILRLGLRGDMFQLEGELGWAGHARETVSWLLSRDAIWPATHRRRQIASGHDRQDARERLFARMADRAQRPRGVDGTERP